MLLEVSGAAAVVSLNRLRVDAAKERVMVSVEGSDFARRSRKEFLETTCADAEKSFVSKSKPGAGDEFEVDQLFQGCKMGRAQVLHDNTVVFQPLVFVPELNR